jgi:CheY-like chemotaxis protein
VHVPPAPTRILVIDDDEMLRDVLGAMLESDDRVVELAAGGAEGLAAIQARRPDLVLLDLHMPGLTGWDVIDRLNDLPSPPPVVAMSGMEPEGERSTAVSPFVCGFLAKPFLQDQLVKTCARALEAAHTPAPDAEAFRDRRSETRRNLILPAALLSADGVPAAQGQILNLSSAGAQIDLGAALNAGMEVALAFDIPGGRGPFRVTARVRWKKDGKLGLSFVDVPEEDRKRLAELLATP